MYFLRFVHTAKVSIKEKATIKKEWNSIIQRHEQLKKDFNPTREQKILIKQIDDWRIASVAKIDATRAKLIKQLQERMNSFTDRHTNLMSRIRKPIDEWQREKPTEKNTIESVKKLLAKCEMELQVMHSLRIEKEKSSYISPIILVEDEPTVVNERNDSQRQQETSPFGYDEAENSHVHVSHISSQPNDVKLPPIHQSGRFAPTNSHRSYPLLRMGVDQIDQDLENLLQKLEQLPEMDKNAMSGKCEVETSQMEEFLRREFGFENIPGQHIVDGVRDFRLRKPIQQLDATKPIYFPTKTSPSFAMTPQEIIEWQRSYSVYAPQDKTEITEQFLLRALKGKSGNGPDAFLMKFVVRVSTCPILMEFDAKVIHRQLEEKWPHFIKLVSVTGVDFAGRKHDVDDIRTYIRNWQQIFQLDPRNGLPIFPNGRDFVLRRDAPRTDLDETLIFRDLKMMARMRLHACNREKVEIVVETGIGLGVFAGSYIGIDDQVRKLSARAVREVLEKDAKHLKGILAVVFALPIFPSKSDPNGFQTSVYKAFAEEFSNSKYHGPIPVIIADQDMHRLAVAIAKFDYQVSELNPADSHGVFGEYWQNRGPAVEEKLALTTLGLLVQHHLINPYVLHEKRYHFI